MRLAVPALARLSPTFEEPRIPLREMADELNAELAEAKKAFDTANTNWTADPGNFGLEKVKLSADLVVKEIEFKIKEAEVKALVTQGKGEDDARGRARPGARRRWERGGGGGPSRKGAGECAWVRGRWGREPVASLRVHRLLRRRRGEVRLGKRPVGKGAGRVPKCRCRGS